MSDETESSVQFICATKYCERGYQQPKKFDALRVYAKKMPPQLALGRDLKIKLGETTSRQQMLKQTKTSPKPICTPVRPPEPTQLAGGGGHDEDKPLPKPTPSRMLTRIVYAPP